MAQVGSGVTRSRTHALGEDEFFNTEAFWKKRADTIPADQLFFHRFFNLKSKQPSSSRVQTGGDEEDALVGSEDELPAEKEMEEESELDSDDDADEKEIWKVMKATMPGKEELEGLEDSDDDDEEFDYVDSDEAEEDDDGPNVIPGMTFSDESRNAPTGKAPTSADWEDSDSDGGNVFDEDDDDLLPFTDFNAKKRGADSCDDEEDEAVDGRDAKKRRKQADKKKRKKSMQNLPTFASADDYAHLLGGEDDDEE